MLKLVKFLRPFTLSILISIGLLYGQAQADLALPDYMSDIVNIGIQQSGFESGVPNVLPVENYEKLVLFLNDEEVVQLEESYQLIDESNEDFSKHLEVYPNLGSTFYVINTDDDLDFLLKPLMMMSGIEQMMASTEDIEINGQVIPAGTDLYMMFSQMPYEMRNQMMDDQLSSFGQLGDTVLEQGAVQYVKNMYEDLGSDLGKIQQNYILRVGAIMLLITFLGAIASITVGYIAARVAAGVGRNLREQIFNKVSLFSNKEFDEFSTASLITRSTNDVNQIQNLLVIMIRMVFYAPLLGVGGVIRTLDSNANMSWIIALAVAVLLIVIGTVFSIAVPKFKLVQKLVDRLNLVTRENLSGMLVIRAFNTQKFEEERFEKANNDLMSTNLFVNRLMAVLFPIMMFVMNGTTLLIVWVGANEIANSNMLVGDMMAFMQYGMQIIFAFLMMSMMFILIPRASVSAGRINEILTSEPTINDKEETLVFNEPKGVLSFNDVSFKYEGAEANMLKNISFDTKPGMTTAIIGSTGSGKSTLLNLIPRFYDATEGSITIDGVDIRDVKQHDLRQLIGYVPQKSVLFSGTIENNIKYSDETMSDEVMEESLRIAQGIEIVDEKDEGYQTTIAQGGGNVSGGQKQRLSIARTIAKDPLIYLFDDSFSALDFKTDKALRNALEDKTQDKSVIIVAQRISTIKNADQIIVLDDGQVVGLGKHKELLDTCTTYQEIAYSQLSKEELA
jgi:ATP-binding cassette subfamily B protein